MSTPESPEAMGPVPSPEADFNGQRELRRRAAGRTAIWLGAVGAVLAFLAAALWRAVHHAPMPYEVFLTALAGSVIAVCYGLTERANRPIRKTLQLCLEQQRAIAEAMADVGVEVNGLWWNAYGKGFEDRGKVLINGSDANHSTVSPLRLRQDRGVS